MPLRRAQDWGRTVGPAKARRRGAGTAAPRAVGAPLADLQRALGNAAVSRLIGDARNEHGADCGHQQGTAAVQRSTVHNVLRGSGQPMAAPLRQEMEARLGADFSDVRLHTGANARRSAGEIGAVANDDEQRLLREITAALDSEETAARYAEKTGNKFSKSDKDAFKTNLAGLYLTGKSAGTPAT